MTHKLERSRLYELPPVPLKRTGTTPLINAGGEGAPAPLQLSNCVNALNDHLSDILSRGGIAAPPVQVKARP